MTAPNRLGLRFAVDTNIIGDGSADVGTLWRLHEAGWIDLGRTDVIDTELQGDTDVVRRDRLTAESAQLIESMGPFVPDHSRVDYSVNGSRRDGDLLGEVFRVLSPPQARSVRAFGNHLRDAMHVAWAIRYAYDGFVTRDGERADGTIRSSSVLGRREGIRTTFNGFAIMRPPEALALVDRRVYGHGTRTGEWPDGWPR